VYKQEARIASEVPAENRLIADMNDLSSQLATAQAAISAGEGAKSETNDLPSQLRAAQADAAAAVDLKAKLSNLSEQLAAARADAFSVEEAKGELNELRSKLSLALADASAGENAKAEVKELRLQLSAAQAGAAAADEANAELSKLREQLALAQADAVAGKESKAELNELRTQLRAAQAAAAAGALALLRLEVAGAETGALEGEIEDAHLVCESSATEVRPPGGDQERLSLAQPAALQVDYYDLQTVGVVKGEASSCFDNGPLSVGAVPAIVLFETRQRRRDTPLRVLRATRGVAGRAASKIKCAALSVIQRAQWWSGDK